MIVMQVGASRRISKHDQWLNDTTSYAVVRVSHFALNWVFFFQGGFGGVIETCKHHRPDSDDSGVCWRSCAFSLLIALLRGMSNFLLGDNFGGRLAADYGFDVTVLAWSFWYMIIRYLLLCYSVLHIACGFELALDSFTLRFFNELDLEEALEEWTLWWI